MTSGETGPDGEFTPQDAFSLLGNGYRARIILALGEAQGTRGPRPELSFSELYAAADVGIATSQFNYHLQKLVGPFVDRSDEGYRLRHEGVRLYRTIMAGTYTAEVSIDPFRVGTDCYHCGSPIEAQYADRRLTIVCTECGREYSDTTMPPSLLEDDEETLLSRLDQSLRQRILAFSNGVCAVCANGVDTAFLPGAELPMQWSERIDVFVHRACEHCGAQHYMSVGLSLLYDADLIAYFHHHGLDVTTTPIWELEFAMTDRYVEVRSTDPWEVALRLERNGAELEIVVDGGLNDVARSSSW